MASENHRPSDWTDDNAKILLPPISSPVRFEEFPEMETRAGRNLDRNLRIIGRFQSRWH